ncbi:cyclin-A1-4-like [Humulus lupulus]|uniref:cyclin-A1-4-like n=1 Tax=Humulus lupulus TaxID=3486 RepID=UPI002B413019|nr:cyclin-A1-4-like [Humulus lupulus]
MKSSSDNLGKKIAEPKPPLRKKRPALLDVTNRNNGPHSHTGSASSILSFKPMVPCLAKIGKKNEFSFCTQSTDLSQFSLPTSSSKRTITVPSSNAFIPDAFTSSPGSAALPSPSFGGADPGYTNDSSSTRSTARSISLDEVISIWDYFKREDIDHNNIEEFAADICFEGKTTNNLFISNNLDEADNVEVTADNFFEMKTTNNHLAEAGNMCDRDLFFGVDMINVIAHIDNLIGPQLCATTTADIYKYLRAFEANNRPSIDYMERIQKDIDFGMRAVLINWLVEVAESYRLSPDTLFLTVNYIDRYLSGNEMKREHLQLLGVACMMIAAKFDDISPPHVKEFSYITDETYSKWEVLQMESAVLKCLKFEMSTPTPVCFLRRFVSVAQLTYEAPTVQLECMANYITELSLVDYHCLCYAPSMIAASATFLAKYILSPSKEPWNSTLMTYTFYLASDLFDCVKALHGLFNGCSSVDSSAVKKKYSQHEYKFVAKKRCPQLIPLEFFLDESI